MSEANYFIYGFKLGRIMTIGENEIHQIVPLTIEFDITELTAFTPFTSLTADAVEIDWGDGTVNNSRSHTYTTTGTYLIDVLFTNLSAISFENKSGLKVVTGAFDNCENLTSLTNCFHNCQSLTAVASTIFHECKYVTDFTDCFSYSGLSSIPIGLFDQCIRALSFQSCFALHL